MLARVKLDDLLARDADKDAEARELHDADALAQQAKGRPHKLWDDCTRRCKDSYRRKAARRMTSPPTP